MGEYIPRESRESVSSVVVECVALNSQKLEVIQIERTRVLLIKTPLVVMAVEFGEMK